MSDRDPSLTRQIERLYEFNLYRRWLFVMICWLTLGQFALWQLRGEFTLWREHFTWVAVRYGLAFNLIPAFSLFFCIGVTGAVLVWQSLHILNGLSPREKMRLENQVRQIRQSGPGHPLWKWVCETSQRHSS
ncbi:hypothetical protein VB715_11700 [Crocosphaera sp. UHCC 0190]|uniref:hypothetical protein n=1 Tax=Crocosphaera sp. UHCC 0190 TaxID=3110246 RepID=UPI002B1EFA20|nr:hypothetical protein [Crocosphaera sp. UHCC 0190]MEA5510430.1 hypothetical protein [Crocosphaera sp. UHCC 0190]